MFDGKMKAVTFSYDDGVTQDKRLIEIFDYYGLKATFNLNSELLGVKTRIERMGREISHNRFEPEELTDVYKGHEVAVHTLTHPNLTQVDADEVIRQVNEDQKNLERLCGCKIRGMAYPGGGVNYTDEVADIIGAHTNLAYARTTVSTHDFELQQDLLRFKPTVYHVDQEMVSQLTDRFLAMEPEKPQLFYIWGHSYEFDAADSWRWFEGICKRLAGKDDIFYGTNSQVLLG